MGRRHRTWGKVLVSTEYMIYAGLVVAISIARVLITSTHLQTAVVTPSSKLTPKQSATSSSAGGKTSTPPTVATAPISKKPAVTNPSTAANSSTPSTTTTTPSAATGLFATSPSWSQNFATMSDGPIDSSLWGFNLGNGGPDNPGWGNNEDEYYTNSQSNVRVQSGQMIIEAQQQTLDGFNYTSARITTLPSLNFTYGKLDVVAELPAGVGTWPAIWLLPSHGEYALTTPAGEADPLNWLRDGEIDIMEAVGSIPGQVSSSAHSYIYNPTNGNQRTAVTNIANDTTTFHDYEVQWTPTSLEFLVDGVVYHTVTKSPTDTYLVWPYNQPFYLILNIALGGTNGGTETQQFPPYGIDNSSGPWEMSVKSINYYPYTGN